MYCGYMQHIFRPKISAISYFLESRGFEQPKVSTCGRPSPDFVASLGCLFNFFQAKKVVFAFDNDEGGEEMYALLGKHFSTSVESVRIVPSKAVDWNDELLDLKIK